MHLLWSIPSENQHLLKCVFIEKNICVQKCWCSFYSPDKPHWRCIPAHPLLLHRKSVPPATGCVGLYFILSIRKGRGADGRGKWKQGARFSSWHQRLYDGSLLQTPQQSTSSCRKTDKYSIFTVRFLVCQVIILTHITDGWLSTVSDQLAI